MSSKAQDVQPKFIALNKLKASPDNVRITPHTPAHIQALADSIAAHGLIQNLVVKTEIGDTGRATGHFLVTAGEGRRLAYLLRAKRKQVKPDQPIRCIIDDQHNPQALSLAENELRQTMSPADQFVAFKKLVDGGQTVEEVAAQFGVTPLVVQRRLKLANVAPEFIAMYRQEEITLDHLMALALIDDHARQVEVWKSLRNYNRDPESVRQALTQHEIALQDPMVRFVGLKAYQKAGGLLRRDLFSDTTEDGFVLDPALLKRLANEKLERRAARLKKDGCAWVDIVPHLDYSQLATYGRLQCVSRDPNPAEQLKLDAYKKERDSLERDMEAAEGDEDRFEALTNRIDEIDGEIDELRDELTEADPEQQAFAGAIVAIGHDGNLRIEEGLLKPEDRRRFARLPLGDAATESHKTPRIHSAVLTRRLTAHRTLALQITLARRPDIALIALTHRLLAQTFYGGELRASNAVQVTLHADTFDQHGPDLKKCTARIALNKHGDALRAELPEDADSLFGWLTHQTQENVLRLLAYCVARTLNEVSIDEEDHPHDALMVATALDMRDWWTATGETYFASVPRSRILEVLKETVSPEVVGALSNLKKGELVVAAEERLAGAGWLPSALRQPA
jgi:ParB family chromosome partitioning protein